MASDTIDLKAILDEVGPIFAERTAAHDADDSFVEENYALLKERKVFSATVPKDIGGGGASHREMCEFLRGLAGYCSSTALAVSMHQHLVAAQVFNRKNGKPAPVLEKVAANEIVLVSTGAGDWLLSNGSAEKVEGGYRVNGKKAFASGSLAGAVLVTSSIHEDPKEGKQVLHFPVPMSAEGVSVGSDWKAMGMRGTGSNTVTLKDVFVPEAAVALARPRGPFHPVFNIVSAVAMPYIISVYVGVAESAAKKARDANQGATDPESHFLLGEMENHLATAQLALESMKDICNDWEFAPVVETANAILIRKTIAAKACIATVEKAAEAVGGRSYFRKAGMERLLRDVHASQFHPLQEKKQHLFSGRLAAGLEPVESPKDA